MEFWLIVTFIAALLIMLVGLAGTVLPAVPGAPLIFVTALVYALIEGFDDIDSRTIALFAVMTGVAMLVDYLATLVGVKKMGGTYFGVAGSVLGMIAGFFLLGGLPGLIMGAFAGAVLFEMTLGRKTNEAVRAGLGTLIGFVLGSMLRFGLAAAMIGIFAWRVLAD